MPLRIVVSYVPLGDTVPSVRVVTGAAVVHLIYGSQLPCMKSMVQIPLTSSYSVKLNTHPHHTPANTHSHISNN